MSDWVPCYAALTRGRKRALPRATRFIFLELCIVAREGAGLVELTPGLDLDESVHDIIGGNRKEIAAAMSALLSEEMIECTSQPGFLTITNWERWKLRDATNAERQARFRERKRNGMRNAQVTAPPVTPPLPVTVSNASRSDQRRSEKKRSAATPLQDHDPRARETSGKTTDADFEAECARAAAVAETKRREHAVAPPAPLSAADFQILEGKKP